MNRLSFVHLDHFFEIEAQYLVRPWFAKTANPNESQLAKESLETLMSKFSDFVNDLIWRPLGDSSLDEIISPLDSGRKPVLSKEHERLVEAGVANEIERLGEPGYKDYLRRQRKGPKQHKHSVVVRRPACCWMHRHPYVPHDCDAERRRQEKDSDDYDDDSNSDNDGTSDTPHPPSTQSVITPPEPSPTPRRHHRTAPWLRPWRRPWR